MAEVARVVETASSTMPATAVDIRGGVTLEALQTQEETGSQAALIVTEGDDSVFYSEDEEIPQEESMCAPRPVFVGSTWLTQPQPSPEIQDSGGEEYESLTHSPGLMRAGSEHHREAIVKYMENLMENRVKHASSSITAQGVERETETASKNSTDHNEELSKSSKVQDAVSATDGSAQFPVLDRSRLVHIVAESQSEQATETQDRDTAGAGARCLTTNEQHEETEELDQGSESFDDLTQSKFGTVSFRKIRRGIARQRIEEFEAMMQL